MVRCGAAVADISMPSRPRDPQIVRLACNPGQATAASQEGKGSEVCSSWFGMDVPISPSEPPSNAEAAGDVGEDCLSPRMLHARASSAAARRFE